MTNALFVKNMQSPNHCCWYICIRFSLCASKQTGKANILVMYVHYTLVKKNIIMPTK